MKKLNSFRTIFFRSRPLRRFGVRVPAIIVSAYTAPQTIINQTFDHTAVLSSVINCFGLAGELGKRQANMPDGRRQQMLTLWTKAVSRSIDWLD